MERGGREWWWWFKKEGEAAGIVRRIDCYEREAVAAASASPRRLVSGSNNKTVNHVGKKDFIPDIYGPSYPANNLTQQTSQPCGLEYDGSSENTFHSEDHFATGVLASAIYKYCSDSTLLQDHYKAAMEQLAALSLPKHARAAQFNPSSSKQGTHHSWSYIQNQGNNAKNRDIKKPFVEKPSSSGDTPASVMNTGPAVLHPSVSKYNPLSYGGIQKTSLENYFSNGDGDFCKRPSETTASQSNPSMDSSNDDAVSVSKWNSKKRNGNEEFKLSVEEKNASENEKKSDVLLKYLRSMNLNLKPDPIEHKEECPSSLEVDTSFSYPDFLPPPYNTLDLQKMSVLKWEDWKSAFNPPLEESTDKLISRLVEMERLQQQTILKERTKDQPVSPTVNSRTSSSRDMYQLKQLRVSDFSRHQAGLDGATYSLGSNLQETELSRCNCQHCRNNKGNTGGSFSVRPNRKHFRGVCNTFKGSKTPVMLDSSHAFVRRSLSCSGSSTSLRSAVKMTVTSKLLSPSMPVTGGSLPCSESAKFKQPRTKRKACRKNLASVGKPFHSQRLKSVSVISKQKYSQVDDQ